MPACASLCCHFCSTYVGHVDRAKRGIGMDWVRYMSKPCKSQKLGLESHPKIGKSRPNSSRFRACLRTPNPVTPNRVVTGSWSHSQHVLSMLIRHLSILAFSQWFFFPPWIFSPSKLYNPWFTPNKVYAFKSIPHNKYEQMDLLFTKDHWRRLSSKRALKPGSLEKAFLLSSLTPTHPSHPTSLLPTRPPYHGDGGNLQKWWLLGELYFI